MQDTKWHHLLFTANGAQLSVAQKATLVDLSRKAELTLAPDTGLPGRDWYRHLIYAPGRFTGYGAKTLPGVCEAIEEERFADVDRYSALTGKALEDFAARLDQATAVLGPR